MTTLHLEVTVNDVAAFKAGFADHTETRRQAGVRADLRFLEEKIWKDSPALVGTPEAKVLEPLALV